MMQLANLFSLECLGDGPTHCIALVATMNRGKPISMAKQNMVLPCGTRTLSLAASGLWPSICFTDGRSVARPSQKWAKGENGITYFCLLANIA